MGSKVSIAEWDNNQSLKSLQVRYTDVLGRFLAGRGFRQRKTFRKYLVESGGI